MASFAWPIATPGPAASLAAYSIAAALHAAASGNSRSTMPASFASDGLSVVAFAIRSRPLDSPTRRGNLCVPPDPGNRPRFTSVSYTHLRAHETRHDLVCRLLL